jgi:hypothetical protein
LSPAAPSGGSPFPAASVLASLPPRLRDELVNALNEVVRNYRERRWEPSELNGGKLCEVAYSIIRGHVDGKFPSKASKPNNMVDACKALEQADRAKFSRSVRIQVPRMLVALYEVRNNRGVGHVGGDVDPNLMDATAVVAMSRWIVAEIVRVFHAVTVDEAQDLVETIVERTLPIIWKIGDVVRVLKPKMAAKDKALVLLYHARAWVDEDTLRAWAEYANSSMFRSILKQCHKEKLIEYDGDKRRATLSPPGIAYVEESISLEL